MSNNGVPVSVDSPVKHGDNVKIVPATSGISATATISDIAGEVGAKYMTLNGVMYEFGIV